MSKFILAFCSRKDINRGIFGNNYKFNSYIFDIIRVVMEIESEARKCGKYEEFKEQNKYLQIVTCL